MVTLYFHKVQNVLWGTDELFDKNGKFMCYNSYLCIDMKDKEKQTVTFFSHSPLTMPKFAKKVDVKAILSSSAISVQIAKNLDIEEVIKVTHSWSHRINIQAESYAGNPYDVQIILFSKNKLEAIPEETALANTASAS